MVLKEINGPVLLEIPGDPGVLFLVRGVVERLSQRLDFPREDIQRMVLAVDEACTNVIRHAYGNRPGGRIMLTFQVKADRIEILIRDFGAPANPETFKPRDLKEVRPGGLGVHFIQSAMDEVKYEAPPEGGTLLTMIKYRPRKEGIES